MDKGFAAKILKGRMDGHPHEDGAYFTIDNICREARPFFEFDDRHHVGHARALCRVETDAIDRVRINFSATAHVLP